MRQQALEKGTSTGPSPITDRRWRIHRYRRTESSAARGTPWSWLLTII